MPDDLPPTADECVREMHRMDPALTKMFERLGPDSEPYQRALRRYKALQEKEVRLRQQESRQRLLSDERPAQHDPERNAARGGE
jgi:hypothetical protein